MSKYNFYYDESEHSRRISYDTVSASNYYDNFVTMIVGWSAEKDDILQQHALLRPSTQTEKIVMVKSKVRCFNKNNSSMVLLPSTSRTLSL